MARITIHLDDETAQRLRARAKADGLTASAWIARLQAETRQGWPAEVLAMAGSWSDAPSPRTREDG